MNTKRLTALLVAGLLVGFGVVALLPACEGVGPDWVDPAGHLEQATCSTCSDCNYAGALCCSQVGGCFCESGYSDTNNCGACGHVCATKGNETNGSTGTFGSTCCSASHCGDLCKDGTTCDVSGGCPQAECNGGNGCGTNECALQSPYNGGVNGSYQCSSPTGMSDSDCATPETHCDTANNKHCSQINGMGPYLCH